MAERRDGCVRGDGSYEVAELVEKGDGGETEGAECLKSREEEDDEGVE